MPFVLFPSLCPEHEEKGVLAIDIQKGDRNLPADRYAFLDSYCDEPGCDCRRVILNVVAKGAARQVATISYGWEDLAFYARWMGTMSHESFGPADLKGPILNRLSPQSEMAPWILEMSKALLFSRPEVASRFKENYRLFRAKVEEGLSPGSPVRTHRQAPIHEGQTHGGGKKNKPKKKRGRK